MITLPQISCTCINNSRLKEIKKNKQNPILFKNNNILLFKMSFIPLPSKTLITPDKFYSRTDRLKLLIIPESEFSKIIVTPLASALGFRIDCYNDFFLEELISRETFEKTIKNVNAIFDEVIHMKKRFERNDQFSYLNYLILLGYAMLVVSLILVLLYTYQQTDENYLVAFEILISISSIFIIIANLLNLLLKPKIINLEETLYERIAEFLKNENLSIYQDHHLFWTLQENSYWMELHILK